MNGKIIILGMFIPFMILLGIFFYLKGIQLSYILPFISLASFLLIRHIKQTVTSKEFIEENFKRKDRDRQYQVFLDNKRIGLTMFENADPPMGIVFGKLLFENIPSGYSFLKSYCKENAIATTDYPEDKLIHTRNIPNLKVLDSSGTEIIGLGCSIAGMDADQFEIIVEGIPYPFYEELFPSHVQAYRDQYK